MKIQSVSSAELHREIARRRRSVVAIERKRERLVGQIRQLDAQIREHGGSPGRGGKRPKNTRNLADALAALLAKQVLSVTEAAEQVQLAGYHTTSPNFRVIVNQTFLKDKRFRRVSRGRYTAAPKGKA